MPVIIHPSTLACIHAEELPEQANEKRFMLLSTCRVGYAATLTTS